jgi:putative membrane protein
MNKAKSVAPKLLSIFSLFWVVLAVNPIYRDIWIAENLILVISLYFLITGYARFHFSNTAYYFIFAFCILQSIGAYYSYAEVPIGHWVAQTWDLSRNHFDRLVHFAFGFLIILPFKEALGRFVTFANQKTQYFVLIMLFIGIGGCYEIIEWWYATLFEQATQDSAFLGSQGDVWDAEKDVLLAGIGAWLYLVFFDKSSS